MNSMVLTILAATLGAVLLMLSTTKGVSKEGFWGLPSRTWKVEKVLQNVSNARSDYKRSDFYQSPNFQAIIPPRFSNVNYGASIRAKLPPYNAMGVPVDPHTADLNIPPPHHIQEGAHPSPMIDADQITQLSTDDELTNPIVYDRYIFSNRNSRLRAHGDPIRGDIPVIPIQSDWFRPNVHPNVDLQAGAINVLSGYNNETAKATANLIYMSSGKADTTIGGVDLSQNQTFNLANGIRSST